MLSSVMLLFFPSCKKDVEVDRHYAIPAAKDLQITDLKARKATLTWSYDYSPVQSFTVELSTSSTFLAANLVKKVTLAADSNKTVVFDSLASLTPYYIRIKASNGDPMFSSAYSTVSFTSAEVENIFNSVQRSDLTATSAMLKWNSPKAGTVTHIIITPSGGTPMPQINLTDADIAARQIQVNDLQQATTYKAAIYDGDENKGEIAFTTLDPNAAITINSSLVIYETLQDAIAAAVSGDVINIGAAVYDFSGGDNVEISNKSLTIKAANDATKPEIKSKILNLAGNVEYLKLSGLKLVGISAQTLGISSLTGATDITMENCDISGPTAGLMYASTSTTLSASVKLTINNCLFHDYGAGGGDFIDFRGGSVMKINVKNSSFWNLGRAFLRIDATAASTSSEPIIFESCTFNNFCNGGKFVYVRSAGAKTTFSKCIITNMVTNQDNGVSGTGTTLTFNQCDIYGSNSKNIRSVGTNTGTTELDPQYANAAQGDFTVGNATVKAAGQGDPRWLK